MHLAALIVNFTTMGTPASPRVCCVHVGISRGLTITPAKQHGMEGRKHAVRLHIEGISTLAHCTPKQLERSIWVRTTRVPIGGAPCTMHALCKKWAILD